jgi:hypothetical protein
MEQNNGARMTRDERVQSVTAIERTCGLWQIARLRYMSGW